MSKVKITVIVPVYNTVEYIEKCVVSLVNQTYKNIEIILIDDGSELATKEKCDKLAIKYKDNVKVFHKTNGGTSSAKNLGIEQATADYIAFVDSDDFVEENYISDLAEMIEKNVDLIVMGYKVFYENTNKEIGVLPKCNNKITNAKSAVRILGVDGLLNVDVSKLYKRKILLDNNIKFENDFSTGEDLIFNCKYITKVCNVAISSKTPQYYYVRRDTESLVNKYRDNLFEISKYLLDEVLKLYSNLDMNSDSDKVLLADFKCDYMVSCISNLYRKDSEKNPKKRRKQLKEIFDYSKKNDVYKTSRKNRFSSIFLHLYNRNVFWADITYSVLFWLRNTFSFIYMRYRDWVFKIK